MKVFDIFRKIWRALGQTSAGMTVADFESKLPPNAIVIPYTMALTNPVCFIVKSPSPEDFLAFITKHAAHYDGVYIVKKSIGSGRFNYVNPNFYVGCSVDVG